MTKMLCKEVRILSEEEKKEKIHYAANVIDLKNADKNSRIYRAIKIILLEMGAAIFAIMLFGEAALLGFAIAIFLIFPSPQLLVPSQYRITDRGLIYGKERLISIKKKFKLEVKEEKKYVSVSESVMKGEFMRLYSPEPEIVLKILDKLKKAS
jgi:uncharacterized membrane protein